MEAVIFELVGQCFALPAPSVSEVLDPLPVTPLPFAPAHADGLVSVAGQVVMQMDGAVRLGVGARLAADKGSILVVDAGGTPCAVHVSRVLAKVAVPESDIAACGDPARVAVAAAVLKGEFSWQKMPVLLLDVAAFALDDMVATGVPTGSGGLLGSAAAMTEEDTAAGATGQDFPCVVVECNGERYAFRLGDVGEVEAVGKLTLLPHAPREVAGMAVLRGMPLLALSLGSLLGGPGDAAQSAMVVVESRGKRFALLAEKIVGIERFAVAGIQAVEQMTDIEGYLTGAGGIMIGLVNVDALISAARFADYGSFLMKRRIEGVGERTDAATGATRRLLTFRLGEERCALPLEWVQRVEEYRTETAVPGGGAAGLSGVVQVQGEVAVVVDLRAKMGLPVDAAAAGAFLVVRRADGVWALTVDRVERVMEIREADIEPVKTVGTDYVGAVGRAHGKLLSIITLEPLQLAA